MKRLVSLLAAALLAATLLAPTASASWHTPVFAYYYAWWDNYDPYYHGPADGLPSDDPAALTDAINQARAAGIDAFIVSWTGTGDRPDRAVQFLMDHQYFATIHFDTPRFAAYGVEDVIAQLRAFYDTRLGHPYIATLAGKPVIFFWRSSTFDTGTWDYIRSVVDPGRQAHWIADGDQFGIIQGSAWDGISPYAIAWSNAPQTHLASWGERTRAAAPGKFWLPPVSPGCDDSRVRPTTCFQPRSLDYYQATWDGARASGPDAVVVSTFNEWAENTQVAISAAEGDAYLALTRANVDGLRAGH